MWVDEFFLFPFAPLGGPNCILLVYLSAFPGFFFDEYILPFTHPKKKKRKKERKKKQLECSLEFSR